MYYELVFGLQILKLFHDIGIYEKAAGNIRKIGEEDYMELFLIGIEHVAQIYDIEELGEEVCCGGHTVYHFSDPALLEYYRLCRLYEYRESVTPQENPYVIAADRYFVSRLNSTEGNFGAYYNDNVHIREICLEVCPEHPIDEYEFLVLVYDTMEYYRREVVALQSELARGPMVMLPALPAPRRRRGRRRPNQDKSLMKAS